MQKRPFEIILYVGRVTSLQIWVSENSCHGQTLINECSISEYPSNFEVINENSTSAFNYWDDFNLVQTLVNPLKVLWHWSLLLLGLLVLRMKKKKDLPVWSRFYASITHLRDLMLYRKTDFIVLVVLG